MCKVSSNKFVDCQHRYDLNRLPELFILTKHHHCSHTLHGGDNYGDSLSLKRTREPYILYSHVSNININIQETESKLPSFSSGGGKSELPTV